jgi:ubiquinone/menaquinone biosynthesis C-methylase UbiE
LGDIEHLPLAANRVDVVVSNCVLNLVPDKAKAFLEIYRVLKPGGHFSISDVVLLGELPEKIQQATEMYAGCVSGALQKTKYVSLIHEAGFKHVTIQKEKPILIPDDILQNYLTAEEITAYRSSGKGIFSITVYAEKPVEQMTCTPGGGCC